MLTIVCRMHQIMFESSQNKSSVGFKVLYTMYPIKIQRDTIFTSYTMQQTVVENTDWGQEKMNEMFNP